MRKIYLAGPMLDCNDGEMKYWRGKVTEALKEHYTFIDPVELEVNHKEKRDWKALVEGDLKCIQECDIVLAYCWKGSPGTSQEILYSKLIYKKQTLVVNMINSPWLHYHADRAFETLDEAIAYLLGQDE